MSIRSPRQTTKSAFSIELVGRFGKLRQGVSIVACALGVLVGVVQVGAPARTRKLGLSSAAARLGSSAEPARKSVPFLKNALRLNFCLFMTSSTVLPSIVADLR